MQLQLKVIVQVAMHILPPMQLSHSVVVISYHKVSVLLLHHIAVTIPPPHPVMKSLIVLQYRITLLAVHLKVVCILRVHVSNSQVVPKLLDLQPHFNASKQL